MVLLGSGDWIYEVSGEDWGNLPEGATYKEATAVDVDANDNVYVFNRGTHPMIVFDTEGNVQRTWGHGIFKNPHWRNGGTGRQPVVRGQCRPHGAADVPGRQGADDHRDAWDSLRRR